MKSKYFIQIIYLKNCPHSYNALQLLINNNIPFTKITVTNNDKHIYKNDIINTFPQIYLKKKNHNDSLLIGGFDNIYTIINNYKNNINNIDNFIENINVFKFSKKVSLRIFQLLNSKL